MKIELINYTRGAKNILIFAKRTRRMDSSANLSSIEQLPEKEKTRELEYIFNTISGPWEFVDYTFFISGVTRAFTHQLVRHRVGTSFAQESLRIADKINFDYLDETGEVHYLTAMKEIQHRYASLLGKGVPSQKARGILPTNILTSIVAKFNLRSLNTLMNVRLCVRTAGEFQRVAYAMREKVLKVHPWAEPALLPFCLEWGSCKFPNFKECPIKIKFPGLQKDRKNYLSAAKSFWEKTRGDSQQPK